MEVFRMAVHPTIGVSHINETKAEASSSSASAAQEEHLTVPQAKKVRVVHEAHGDLRMDDYHWMRDLGSTDTLRYLEDWNRYTSQVMDSVRPLTEKLYTEFVDRIEAVSESVPHRVGPFLYYYRMEEGKEHPIHCRKSTEGDQEQVLLDGNVVSKDYEYFSVKAEEPSPDGRFVAYMIDTDGSQFGTIMILDTQTGKFLEEKIPHSDGGIVWNTRSDGFWYTKVNDEMRTDKLYCHEVGTPIAEDRLIANETDPLFDLGISSDKLKRYLVISASSKDTSEVCLAALDDSEGPIFMVHEREKGLQYHLVLGAHTHYLMVSKDKSNWALYKSEAGKLSKADWVEVRPSNPDVDLVDVELFKGHLALLKREQGLKKVEIISLEDGKSHEVEMPQQIGDIAFEYNDDWDTPLLRFTFDSPVYPLATFHYHMGTRSLELLKQKKAGSFDPSQYESERVWAVADDGTKVPISLFFKKGMPRDGSMPLYLYGYGSYGVTYDPYFSVMNASFMERGVCFAIAHVRGGGDLGRQWYEQGSMQKKRNTFTDFINCAEHLVNQGFTSPDRLAIGGGSAGGLLMGAVINMRPDLFKACLASVPFVDVVTTMFDESLPLTTQEWIEWGNPNEKSAYEYMKSFSPYDGIVAQDYPALYVVAGLNDKQVSCHEPAKWVAKLAEFKTDRNPLLFRINMGAGHHGASGRYSLLKERAPDFAFLLSQLGFVI